VVYVGYNRESAPDVAGTVTVFGRLYQLRTTYTKQSDDAFTLVNEERRPDGTWLRDETG
jgi:hypothetical protein